MASYNELLALIDAYINQNGVQAITGQVLNGVLRAMVDQLGRGYTIMGAAVPTTDPGTPDGPESWFASTPGTYTDMGGLTVANAELALLSYTPSDGWSKTTLTQGITEVQATVDANVGTPAVSSDYVNGVLYFDFKNIKGNTGDPAGFGTVSATVDSNIGTPAVSVQTSGPDTAKNMVFAFRNLKGETGVTSVVATVDNTTGTPTCSVSLVGQELHLDFTGLKGAQGDTGVSADYPITIANNLTTNDPTAALSAAMGVQLESEVSQLDLKVDELAVDLSKEVPSQMTPAATAGHYWKNGAVDGTSANWENYQIDLTALVGKKISFSVYGSVGADAYNYILDSGNNILWSAQLDVATYSYSFTVTPGMSTLLVSNRWASGEASFHLISYELDVARKEELDIVENEVKDIENVLNLAKFSTTENNYVRYDNGVVTGSGSGLLVTSRINILGCTYIRYSRIKTTENNTYWGIAFYDEDNNYISGEQAVLRQDEAGYEDKITNIPEGAVYVRASILPENIAEGFYLYGNGFTVNILDQELEKTILRVTNIVKETSRFVRIIPTWDTGYYYSEYGNKLSNANWSCAELDIEQYRGFELAFVLNSQTNASTYALLINKFGDVIWSERLSAVLYEKTFIVPDDAKTLKLSNRSASGDAIVSVRQYDYISDVIKATNIGILKNKKVSFLGDSITAGSGASPSTKRYSTVLCGYLGATENNLGVAGTCLANNTTNGLSGQRFVTRATQANLSDSDLIIVFGGTNDFSYDSKAIGPLFDEETITPSDRIGGKKRVAPTDVDTFAGAVHELITTIRGIVPTVPVIFVTPLNRGRYTSGRPTSAECNVNGDYLFDFVNAIKEICQFYSIPVLDLNANSELDFNNASIATEYSADKLHPNNKGHEVIASKVYNFILEQIVPTFIS